MLNMSIFNLLPYYLELRGASPSFYGQVAGSMGVSNVIALALFSQYADVFSRKRAVAQYFLSTLAGNALALWALNQPSLNWYVGVRLLHGVFMGLGFPLVFSWVVDLCPPQRKQVALAWFGIAGIVANSLGPFLAELVLNSQANPQDPKAWKAVFAMATVFQVSGFVCWMSTKNSHPIKHQPPQATPAASLLALIKQQPVLLMLLTSAGFGGMFGTVMSFSKNYISQLGLRYVSLLLWAYTVGALSSRVFIQPISTYIPQKHLAPFALGAMGCSFVMLAAAEGYGGLGASGFLYGLSHGVLYPVLFAAFLDSQKTNEAGRAATLFQGGFSVGWGGFPLFGGSVIRLAGFAWLFGILGLFGFVCILLVYRAQKVLEKEQIRQAQV